MGKSKTTKYYRRPGFFEIIKILVWKNFKIITEPKWLCLLEILSPLLFGLLPIGMRLMLPAIGELGVRMYPPFSPDFLPPGNIFDVDSILNTSRLINKKMPIADGLCEVIRKTMLQPDGPSIRDLLIALQKIERLDIEEINFTKPEFVSLLGRVDLGGLFHHLVQAGSTVTNDDFRKKLEVLQSLQFDNTEKSQFAELLANFLQDHRRIITSKLQEFRNLTSAEGLSKRWLVLWSPENPVLSDLMSDAASRNQFIGCGIENSSAVMEAMSRPLPFNSENLILAVVAFPDALRNISQLPTHLPVDIRFPGISRFKYDSKLRKVTKALIHESGLWETAYVCPIHISMGARNGKEATGGSPGYYREGFLGLQSSISAAFTSAFNRTLGGTMPPLTINLQRLPEPAVYEDPQGILVLLFMLLTVHFSVIFFVMSTVRRIVTEKEKKLKESLKILGVSDWQNWLGWLLPTYSLFVAGSVVMTLVLKLPVESLLVLRQSDFFCIFILYAIYSLPVIALCFLITTFFSNASKAVTSSLCLWVFFSLFWSYFLGSNATVSYSWQLWFSAFTPTSAVLYSMQTVTALEGHGLGLTWDTLFFRIPNTEHVPVGIFLEILLCDAVVLMIATLYFERVLPGCSGAPLPWYFPITKKFWFGGRPKAQKDTSLTFVNDPELISSPVGVKIRNLSKIYPNGKHAVDDLSLNLYEGKITVLLGHNGAGKTTAMSMLAGLITPTSGVVKILGEDVKLACEHIGFCSQDNVLIDEFTASDHLFLICSLKGLRGQQLFDEVSKYLGLLDLNSKTDVPTKCLSGGMKRKLSIALALCGGSKVVLFDEPSSGLDPNARRSLWDLILAEKAGRTILLSTHFMDDADLLGDQIVILANGKLKAAGSSFDLKKNHGGGYCLVLVKDNDCNPNAVTRFLNEHFPGIQPTSDVGAELSYYLPDHCSAGFSAAFRDLEASKQRLKILGYGVTTASIEDVFMKVAALSDKDSSYSEEALVEASRFSSVSVGVEPLLTGLSLWLSQIRGLLYKIILLRLRSPAMQFLLLFGPAILAVVGICMSSKLQGTNDLPRRELTLKGFKQGIVGILQISNESMPLANDFVELVEPEGMKIINLSNISSPEEGILQYFAENPISNHRQFLIGVAGEQFNVTAFFNNHAFHLAPTALQLVYNSFLRKFVINQSVQISFANNPLPHTGKLRSFLLDRGSSVSFHLSFYTSLGFLILVAWSVTARIREKSIGSQHIQLLAGVSPTMMSLIAYIMDLSFCFVVCIVHGFSVYLLQIDGFSTFEDIGHLMLVCFSNLSSFLAVSYIIALMFKSQGFAFMVLSTFYFITGPTHFLFWLNLKSRSVIDKTVYYLWQKFLIWLPPYSLSFSIMNMSEHYWLKQFCKSVFEKFCDVEGVVNPCCKVPEKCPPEGCLQWTENFLDYDFPGFGRTLKASEILIIVSFILLHILESRFFQLLFPKQSKHEATVWKPVDFDVEKEWKTVKVTNPSKRRDINLLVKEISKAYGETVAVKNLSLLVSAGECFGLLGVNGAGKTTTFRMLTGDLEPTSGNAFVHGYSVVDDRKQVHKLIGYCPQFDAHLEELTGRETLRMFCLLRGVPHGEVELTCEKLARELLFYPHIDQKVSEYSGGNKRKLSVAVALVGDPPVVFLDEPTTGMDPVAKRYFWEVICRIRSTGKTIILTSHSMEECEALCTRVGIMVQGELLCIGSPQYLKTKFAQGYRLTVKTKPESRQRRDAQMQDVSDFIKLKFPGAVVKEDQGTVLTFHIPISCPLSWPDMFAVLEEARRERRFADYYLGQAGLEEVVLTLTSGSKKVD